MRDMLYDINSEYADILNIIRCKPNIEKTVLSKVLNIAYKTLIKQLETLETEGFIYTKPDLQINRNIFYMCGISVGGSHCKVVITDANYQALEKEEFDTLCEKYDVFQQDFFVHRNNSTPYGYKYFETPEDRTTLEICLQKIIEDIIKLSDISLTEKDLPPIISIGIAFTGSIDTEKQIIVRSHNLDYMKNISRDMLLNSGIVNALKQRKIKLIIDHNAKAMAVSEKFSLYRNDNINFEYHYKKNIACFYLGSGIGCGLILNNRLIRGCNNFSGELGHIQVPRFPEYREHSISENCTCGSSECLEHYLIHDVFQMTRKQFRLATSSEIKDNILKLKQTDPEEFDKRMRVMGYYIRWAVDAITKLLNVGLIIFSGKITCLIDEEAWSYLKPANSELNYAVTNCPMILSNYAALAPSIGAAILSTYPPHELIEWKV